MSVPTNVTPEQKVALAEYWAAKTPDQERAAYSKMMALGLPDSYGPDPVNAELELLRDFYNAWRAFHEIPNDRLHRHQKQIAAQEIVDANHAVMRFQKPNDPELERRIHLVGSRG